MDVFQWKLCLLEMTSQQSLHVKANNVPENWTKKKGMLSP